MKPPKITPAEWVELVEAKGFKVDLFRGGQELLVNTPLLKGLADLDLGIDLGIEIEKASKLLALVPGPGPVFNRTSTKLICVQKDNVEPNFLAGVIRFRDERTRRLNLLAELNASYDQKIVDELTSDPILIALGQERAELLARTAAKEAEITAQEESVRAALLEAKEAQRKSFLFVADEESWETPDPPASPAESDRTL